MNKSLNSSDFAAPIFTIIITLNDFQILMLLQVVLKFSLSEDMIVPFIDNRFLVHIDFTAL